MPPERLSALDASFLYLERPAMHMHVAALSVLDPSTRPDGRLPFGDLLAAVAARIHLAPRFRKRVLEVPGGLALPVWIDDEHFDLDFHLQRAALPKPGGRRELSAHVQRALSRPLDRSRPLWELSMIEGLEDGHVAVLMKVHHALIDGIAGMHLAAALYDVEPVVPGPASLRPVPWTPEQAPTAAQLVRGALEQQLTHPLTALVGEAQAALNAPALAALGLGSIYSGVRSILDMGARPASPFDVRIGPNRRFATAEAPLRRFKDVKNALGGTVNDVVLTVVAGAIHSLLRARKEPSRGRTLRVMVPVSVRTTDHGVEGNRVAPAFVDVPVGPMGPKRRLAEISKGTRHLKDSMQAMGADAIISLGTYAPGGLLQAAARATSRGPWFNLVVSNIPGPQQPLYLCGAQLVASYPSMPLGGNSALSIACASLSGTMAFGLTGDWDAMPDLDLLASAVEGSLADLCKAAGV